MNKVKEPHQNQSDQDLNLLAEELLQIYIKENNQELKKLEQKAQEDIKRIQENVGNHNLPPFQLSMTDSFYDHCYYNQNFVNSLKDIKNSHIKPVFNIFRSRYVQPSPLKKSPERSKSVIKSKEELITETHLLYEAALDSPNQVPSLIFQIVSNLLIAFESEEYPQESTGEYIIKQFSKSKEDINKVAQSAERKTAEIKIQVLLRMEIRRLNCLSTLSLSKEITSLLRCLMFCKDQDELNNFVKEILLERYLNDHKTFLEEICDEIGIAIASSDSADWENESDSASPSISIISTNSIASSSSASVKRLIPQVRPYIVSQNAHQILVPANVYNRTRLNRSTVTHNPKETQAKGCQTPKSKKNYNNIKRCFTTPKGKHILKTTFVRDTPDSKKGPRSEWRRKERNKQASNLVIPKTPLKISTPIKNNKKAYVKAIFKTPNKEVAKTPVKRSLELIPSNVKTTPIKQTCSSIRRTPVKRSLIELTPSKGNTTPNKETWSPIRRTPVKRSLIELTPSKGNTTPIKQTCSPIRRTSVKRSLIELTPTKGDFSTTPIKRPRLSELNSVC